MDKVILSFKIHHLSVSLFQLSLGVPASWVKPDEARKKGLNLESRDTQTELYFRSGDKKNNCTFY